jgi:LysR family transcriptional regulator for bpeEF and oprC
MDRLQSMRVFVEVVDCGSFTKAADVAGLSQASVSSHITQLEQRLGTLLLERTTRSIRLTEEGAEYYALCQRVLSEIDDTESRLAQTREKPHGRLRIEATVALSSRLIVPVLPEFIARYPKIAIELYHTDHLYGVKHETYDVLFRVGELGDSDLIARPISPMRQAVAGAPQYLAARGVPQTPQDLLQHDCIGYIDPITRRSVDVVFEREGERITLALNGHLAANEGESRIAAALAGIGLVMTHAYELREAVAQGKLRIVLPEWKMATRFSVAYPRNRYLSARVRAFVDFMIEKYPPQRMLDFD